MADVFPPDFATPVGRVRKYIPDLLQLEDPHYPGSEPKYYFSDLELQSFVGEYADLASENAVVVHRWDIKRAAADAIDALANNEALVMKKVKTEDLQTDGAAVARALHATADDLRRRADKEEAEANPFFEIVPFEIHNVPREFPIRWYTRWER